MPGDPVEWPSATGHPCAHRPAGGLVGDGEGLTRGCVASISRIEVGEASRRRRNVAKEPATPIHANNNNMAMAA